jgi:hypothetical protein
MKRTAWTLSKISAISAVAVMTCNLATMAEAQVGIYIGRTPPPIRYEARPPLPGPDYAWIDGYWQPYGNSYRWVGGRYDRRPYEGAYWSHPHYDHYQQGWAVHEGHWDREDHGGHHDDHHDGNRR